MVCGGRNTVPCGSSGGVFGRDERLDIITLMMPVLQEGPGAVLRLDGVAGCVSGSKDAGKLRVPAKLDCRPPLVNPSLSLHRLLAWIWKLWKVPD